MPQSMCPFFLFLLCCLLLLQVCVWNVRHCRLVHTLEGHKMAVFAVEMDDSARRVFSGSRDYVRQHIPNLTCYMHVTRVI